MLLYSGSVVYLINYIIGWLLHFKIISMSRITHRIFFAAIIINLVLILLFSKLNVFSAVTCLLSLALMLILPFGRKGGIYHRVISTLGLLLYFLMLAVAS